MKNWRQQLSPIADFLRQTALTILLVMLTLQFLRLIFPLFLFYLRIINHLPTPQLASIVFGTFALPFLAAPLVRYVGLRHTLIVAVVGVVALRLAEQLTFAPSLDLYFVIGGVVLSFMALPLLLGTISKPAGYSGMAILLGVMADNALHTALTTYDLSWRPGLVPILIVVGLAAATLLALHQHLVHLDPTPTEANWQQTITLASLGPWLFLQLVVYQNVARLAVTTGWSLPLAGLTIAIGNLLALFMSLYSHRFVQRQATIMGGLLLIGSLLWSEETGWLGLGLHLLGQFLATGLMLIIFHNLTNGRQETGVKHTVIATGIGVFLLNMMILAYYIVFEIDLGYRSPAVLPLAGAILLIAAMVSVKPAGQPTPLPSRTIAPVIIGVFLLLLPLGRLLTWPQPQAVVPSPTNNEVHVMSYNLRMGFNQEGVLDLETIAQLIEDNGADVVALQEVSRGWVVAGSVDMLAWLSHRLDMPYVYGPTSGAHWGSGMLSRYPFADATHGLYPPDDLTLRRGYMRIEVDIGQVPITIYNTHFHHRGFLVRERQADAFLELWDNQPRTIVLGDLNGV